MVLEREWPLKQAGNLSLVDEQREEKHSQLKN